MTSTKYEVDKFISLMTSNCGG